MAKYLTEAAKAHKREYDKAYARQRRKWLAKHYFCVVCGSAWAEPGRKKCASCAAQEKARRAKADPDGTQRAKANRDRYAQRIANGVCVRCGKPRDGNGRMCDSCRAYCNDATRVYRINQRIDREANNARKGVYTR